MSVSSVLNSAAQSTTPTPSAPSQLNMQTFIQLLTVQLTNQDPLNPMSDTDFFAQLAELGQVQGIDQLNTDATVQKAQSLMGQTVTAIDTTSTPGTTQTVTGVATGLTVKNGVYSLVLTQANGGTVDVDPANIQSITPTPNILQANALLGKTITGTAQVPIGNSTQSATVSGTVQAVGVLNGEVELSVSTQNYGNVTVDMNSVSIVQ